MADSRLPAFGAWWRGNGEQDGEGALIHAGSSTTTYDNLALPPGGRKWVVEYEYTAEAEALVWVVINRFTAANVKLGDVAIFDRRLPAAEKSRVVVEFELPASVTEKWLPSVSVRPSTDVRFHWLKVYEAPTPGGPLGYVWDGATEIPVSVTVWDGATEVPATFEIQA